METVILSIEITPELDKALGEIAEDQMVTKEDIAKGIIAVHLAKAKGNPNFLGIDMDFVSAAIEGFGYALRGRSMVKSIKKDVIEKVLHQATSPDPANPIGL